MEASTLPVPVADARGTSDPNVGDLGEPLKGAWLSPDEILEFLPGVDNHDYFIRAWRKILRNQEERLTRLEMFQLAKAFISLIREDQASKIQFMHKLMMVDLASDEQGPGDINTTYR
jgi:hypothetical protein